MASENVISEKAFSDYIRSGVLVPDQKNCILILFFNSKRSGLRNVSDKMHLLGNRSQSYIGNIPKHYVAFTNVIGYHGY